MKQPTLLDDEGNKIDLPRLEQTTGITLDSIFTPHRYTCSGCGGASWGWQRAEKDPRGCIVCLTCTGREGVVTALITLDIERQRLGLDSLCGSLVYGAVLHEPVVPAPHLPEVDPTEEDYEPAQVASWLPDEIDAARGLVVFPFDDRLAGTWMPPCALPGCERASVEGRRAGVLFDGADQWVSLCARHWAAWERVMGGREDTDDPFEVVEA